MFVACGIWCLADVSSVSPSSEQTGELWANQCLNSAAWTSKNSISTKASNFQIFLKKNGLPTKILKLGTTLSSNQPTKGVPWSFGAPTFTNKKLLDN